MVKVQVGSNNESPIAANDTTKMIVGGTIDIAVLNNDTDADSNGTINTASVVLIDLPAVGVATVQSNGKILVVINALNLGGIRLLGPTAYGLPFIDVDGNNSIDPIDVLQGEKQCEVFQPRN